MMGRVKTTSKHLLLASNLYKLKSKTTQAPLANQGTPCPQRKESPKSNPLAQNQAASETYTSLLMIKMIAHQVKCKPLKI